MTGRLQSLFLNRQARQERQGHGLDQQISKSLFLALLAVNLVSY